MSLKDSRGKGRRRRSEELGVEAVSDSSSEETESTCIVSHLPKTVENESDHRIIMESKILNSETDISEKVQYSDDVKSDSLLFQDKTSAQALEKCIEWLSHHPLEKRMNLKLELRKDDIATNKMELLEYRKTAVRRWVNKIPDSETSRLDEEQDITSESDCDPPFNNEADNNPNVPLVSSYILSNLPQECTLPTAGPPGTERKLKLKYNHENNTVEDEEVGSKNRVYLWFRRQLLDKCPKKNNDLEQQQQQDLAGKVQQGMKEGNKDLSELSKELQNDLGDELGKGKPEESNNDEITRLTNLLQNMPKSRMRTIFSLRKERIPPERSSPPSFLSRVGKQVHGFFANRGRRKPPNRTNRIGPSLTRQSSQLPQQQQQQQQSSNVSRIIRGFFSIRI